MDKEEMLDHLRYKLGLELLSTWIPGRTDTSDWLKGSRHFVCQLERRGVGAPDPYVFQFSMGSAYKYGPKLLDVFNCLLEDARNADDSRDEWEMAQEFGMEIKSKADWVRAVNMYAECQRAREWLKKTFTPPQLDSLYAMFANY